MCGRDVRRLTFGALTAREDVDAMMLHASVLHSPSQVVTRSSAARFLLPQLPSSRLECDKCGVRTHLTVLPDLGSLFPVESARVVVIIVEHIMCPPLGGGNELAMKQ